MEFESLNREELQDILFQLEQALYNHYQWYNSVIRSLICRLPSDRHDLSEDAHKECRFGQWYYEGAPQKLSQNRGFIALGEEHLQMHKVATKLLLDISHGSNISPIDYDNFSLCLEKLRLEISALQQELNELLHNRDALTGAISRINMLPILREQQELVRRNVQSSCIVMFDLDHFKQVNDHYGHAAGDCVLADVTRFMIENMRPFDKIFRVGGEEFLLCLQNIDTQKAFEMVERLREGVAAMAININHDKSIHITASFGITSLKADASVEQSIEQSDKALYKAKSAGRNCTRIFSDQNMGST